MVAGPSRFVREPAIMKDDARREDWLSDSLLSGFVATIAMTVALAGAYGLANALGDRSGNRIEEWLYSLSHNRITDRANDSLVLAIGLNLGRMHTAASNEHGGWQSWAIDEAYPAVAATG